MQRACTSKADQYEIARIMTPLDRDLAQSLLHMRIGNANDPFGKALYILQIAFRRFQVLRCARLIQFHAAAEKPLCIEPAQQQIGIGDSGLFSTPITDRAWVSSG